MVEVPQMTNRQFTEEEKRILKQNPYTFRVTNSMILFTLEFKEVFWKRYQAGLTPINIMLETGYDPNMLGEKRISSITSRIRKTVESGKAFTVGIGGEAKTVPGEKDYRELPIETAIASMQYEIEYLRQEVDFLKKLCALGRRGEPKK